MMEVRVHQPVRSFDQHCLYFEGCCVVGHQEIHPSGLNRKEMAVYLEMARKSIVQSFFRSSLVIYNSPFHMLLYDEDENSSFSFQLSWEVDLLQELDSAWVVDGESLDEGEVGQFDLSSVNL
jgi:hypothetical protein